MIKKSNFVLSSLSIPNSTDYSVVFRFNGTHYDGIVPNSLVPVNYGCMEYEELESLFPSWEQFILTKISETNPELTTQLHEKKNKEFAVTKISKNNLLTQKDGCFYRLDIPISLPITIANRYAELNPATDTDEILNLDKFWYWTCLNTPSIREMLFEWLSKDSWKITNEGMIVAYKNVKEVISIRNNWVEVVTNLYNKVKKWKKAPRNFYIEKECDTIFNTDEIPLSKVHTENYSINLLDEYNRLCSSKDTYTHEYNSEITGQPRLYYTINKETVIDRSLCNSENEACGAGINCMSKYFLEKNGQSYFGDGNTICVLINPSMIVSCPTESGYNKLRSCAVFCVGLVKWENGKIIELSDEVIDKASALYNKDSIVDLRNFTASTNIVDINPKFIGVEKTNFRTIINI
jgi:hypothetical protein